jgi:hypothetical protein
MNVAVKGVWVRRLEVVVWVVRTGISIRAGARGGECGCHVAGFLVERTVVGRMEWRRAEG